VPFRAPEENFHQIGRWLKGVFLFRQDRGGVGGPLFAGVSKLGPEHKKVFNDLKKTQELVFY